MQPLVSSQNSTLLLPPPVRSRGRYFRRGAGVGKPVPSRTESISVVARKTISGQGLLARLRRRGEMLRRPQEASFAARWSAHLFGHLEIATRYRWAGGEEQRYEVFARCGREVACRLKVMERTILIDDQPVKMGAIAGLMTAPVWQKRGLARNGN